MYFVIQKSNTKLAQPKKKTTQVNKLYYQKQSKHKQRHIKAVNNVKDQAHYEK